MPRKNKRSQVPAVAPGAAQAPAAPGVEDVVKFVERLMEEPDDFSLRDCFRVAADTVAYLTAVMDKAAVLGSSYIPKAVRAVGEKAAKGDVPSARLLFEIVGGRTRAPVAQMVTQVNISVPRLRDIVTIDEEGRIVDARTGEVLSGG